MGGPKPHTTIWAIHEKDLLVEIMLEDFKLACMSDNSFKDVTWNCVKTLLENLDPPVMCTLRVIKSQASKVMLA